MLRSLPYLALLGLVLALGYILPKTLQNSDGFAPLAAKMTEEAEVPAVTPTAPAGETQVPPRQATPATQEEEQPPAPAAAPNAAPSAPDLTPFVSAMGSGDLAKAAALLELMKNELPPDKFASLNQSVAAARQREAETAAAKPPPQPVAETPAGQTQMLLVETLRQIQAEQKETAKMLAELRTQPQPPASPPAATYTSATGSSAPLPGITSILFAKDSAFVTDGEAEKLQSALDSVSADPSVRIEIRGFADKSGASDLNLALSRARATAVQDIFRRAQISDSRIAILPMGSFPAGNANATPESMRKVEVLLVR